MNLITLDPSQLRNRDHAHRAMIGGRQAADSAKCWAVCQSPGRHTIVKLHRAHTAEKLTFLRLNIQRQLFGSLQWADGAARVTDPRFAVTRCRREDLEMTAVSIEGQL